MRICLPVGLYISIHGVHLSTIEAAACTELSDVWVVVEGGGQWQINVFGWFVY